MTDGIMNGLGTLSLRRASKASHTCTLPMPLVPIPTKPIAGSYDFYHVNVIVSGVLALFSTFVMLALVWRHATKMSRPREQLYIIRICLFIPILAIGLWVAILVPRTFVYLDSIINIFEAITLTCFFLFICEILASPPSSATPSSPPSRRALFLSPLVTKAQRQNLPLTSGSIFNIFRRNWIGVAQCVPVALVVAVAAVATEAAGVYCLTAHDAHHAHIYLVVVRTISTFSALVGVLRTTLPLRAELKQHRAITKLWAFKALIFLQVVQDLAFSVLDSVAPDSVTNSEVLSEVDFLVGLPSLLVEAELVLFALFFHYAYSVSLYELSDEQQRAGARYAGYGWRLIPEIFKIRNLPVLIWFAFHIREEAEIHESETRSQGHLLSELPRGRHERLGSSSTQGSRGK
ncbi:organic solute transporter Ostalpha-domain-containing protein [Xylariaceae sp. FL1651]|nr:organic solute transporter Ostalpha-domain-containing protein [Xylariaceae sp. FL1651]